MLLNRALRDTHTLRYLALRAAAELPQLECRAAPRRHPLEKFLQTSELLTTARTALRTALLVYDVQRIHIRQSFDRHDT
jgi:hypothetical protein